MTPQPLDVRYPARVRKGKGFVVATLPDLPDIEGVGDTEAEALVAAGNALTEALVALLAVDLPLPKASPVMGGLYIVAGARVQAAVLFRAFRGELTTAELGRRLNTSAWSRVRDLERAENVTLDRADRAARALGYRLILTYEPEQTA